MGTVAIKPIKTEAEYDQMMAQMRQLWDSPENSADANLLEALSILVEQYEKRKYPIEPLDPTDAIKHDMEEKGLNQKDMIQYFGSKERVSEILNRKRPLTLKMIKTLYHDLGIPASALLARR